MVALDFCGTVGHAAYRLVHHNCSMRLFHDFVYLVALSTNKQGYHAFGHEDNDREGFFFVFFEDLVNFRKHGFGTLILFLHFNVINLSCLMIT